PLCRTCSWCFFSSRRRHTRSKRDWSSDVCSSDLMSINKTQVDRRVKLNLELYMKVGKESIQVVKNMNCGINHIGILLRMEKTFGNYLADTYTVNIQSLKTLQSS